MEDHKKSGPAVESGNYSLAERLKYLRQLRGYSQKQLAERSSVSQSTIAQIESERMDPSIKTLEKIAAALDTEPAIFFTKGHVLVFDLKKLRKKYDAMEKLNPTVYMALDQIVRYCREIGFLK